ncbi:MAG: ribosome small subunit-dependent GTPase A [Candidatus Caccovivens sp.]
MLSGLILKKQADLFSVETQTGEVLQVTARKNMKKDGIFVGDRVQIDDDNAICKLEERKNLLIRPPMANIDKMFIVIAPVPKPDLYTVDKLLLFCALNNIKPIVCVNKNDVDAKFCKDLANIYKPIAKTLIFSSLDDSVTKLESEIDGICVLAGQSAVGKSSIINALKGEPLARVDTFSKKIERGKQTTRTVSLYKFGENKFLADTAGFSKLDERLLDLTETELKTYIPEFLEFAPFCKYSSCNHISSKECAVLNAVKDGKISKERYENYVKLYDVLKTIKRF